MKHLTKAHKESVGEGVKEYYKSLPLCSDCGEVRLYLLERRKAGRCSKCQFEYDSARNSTLAKLVEMAEPVQITNAQGSALQTVVDKGVKVGDEFEPAEIWSERGAASNGARRAISTLVKKEVLTRPHLGRSTTVLTAVAYASLMEWKQNG